MSTAVESSRNAMVALLRRELVGPASDGEEMEEPPHEYYSMGILHPSPNEKLVPSDDSAGDDDELAGVYGHRPSALGLTTVVPAGTDRIEVDVDLAEYHVVGLESGSTGSNQVWQRRTCSIPPVVVESPSRRSGSESTDVVLLAAEDGSPRAELHVNWRQPQTGSEPITISLVNKQIDDGLSLDDCSRHFFQCGLRIRSATGFSDLPGRSWSAGVDPEEDELGLLYRERVVPAVGHGCGVDWTVASDGRVDSVATEVMPMSKVPSISFEIEGLQQGDLDWGVLADPEQDRTVLVERLMRLYTGYRRWIDRQEAALGTIELKDEWVSAGSAIIKRLRDVSRRIRTGIRLLEEDPQALLAFRLANLAILMQRRQTEPCRAGSLHEVGDSSHFERSLLDPAVARGEPGGWRPFQLAFILLVLPSLADPRHAERDVVDLLWFPTGGGKTEAYLGLSAFEIFRRRLQGESGGGVAVIKRYTYRVLTFQQFERAGALVCACELIRRSRGDLRSEPITIGMWVGRKVTPNRTEEAAQAIEQVGTSHNPFQVRKCPWCGTTLVRKDGSHGYSIHGGRLRIACLDPDCPFGAAHCESIRECREQLGCLGVPVSIVDEDLYEQPPSMLVATVDKFAQVPLLAQAGRLFGRRDGEPDVDPPSLLIQDELHLINGPLGTMVAMYEAALDVIAETRGGRPKIIGATATLRRGGEQCRGLYGRDPMTQVQAFPPSGLDADDSHFMRIDRSGPGRVYVGVLGSGKSSRRTLVPILAAAAMGSVDPSVVGDSTDATVCDGYSTNVVYHSSLAKLGHTLAMAGDDLLRRIGRLEARARRAGIPTGTRRFGREGVVQLSGQTPGPEIPRILDRLDRAGGDPDSIDVLACTSIVSVGVDKPRLGLMVVHEQPSTVSEYIQASSRVGRGATPGIVVANLSGMRARDLSHYENFKAFHESIYRSVEPTTVTPFTGPARGRAMPAVVVAAMRHGLPLPGDGEASSLSRLPDRVEEVARMLLDRCIARAPEESAAIGRSIDAILDEWRRLARGRLHYFSYLVRREVAHLLRPDGSKDARRGRWAAPNSMRLVDREADLRPIWGARRTESNVE